MSKPVDIKSLSPDALAALATALGTAATAVEIQAAVEAALAAEPIDVNIVGGSSVPFDTRTVASVPAPPTVTQLPSLPCANGALIRADEDMYIYNNGTPAATDGFLVYEGDDIRMTTVTNLDQVYVMPAKNQSITVWAMTL